MLADLACVQNFDHSGPPKNLFYPQAEVNYFFGSAVSKGASVKIIPVARRKLSRPCKGSFPSPQHS